MVAMTGEALRGTRLDRRAGRRLVRVRRRAWAGMNALEGTIVGKEWALEAAQKMFLSERRLYLRKRKLWRQSLYTWVWATLMLSQYTM